MPVFGGVGRGTLWSSRPSKSRVGKAKVYHYTGVGYAALRKPHLLPQLTKLEFGGAVSRVTAEQTEGLRKAAPKCNITKR